MEKENKAKNALNGFFDNCKSSYLNGSKGIDFINPLEDKKEEKSKDNSAEDKLNRIREILKE